MIGRGGNSLRKTYRPSPTLITAATSGFLSGYRGRAAEHLRRELGWSADRYEILGYWRVRKEEWMARYDQIGTELEQVYENAVAEGRSSTEALELYDDALEKAGL